MDKVSRDDPSTDDDRCPAVESSVAAADLASDLRQIYDPVAAKSLPIYFGPILGELFLADH